MPDVTTAIMALNVVLDKVKRLRELSEQLKNVEVNTILSELQLAAADVKLELANERDRNAQLQDEIRRLREQLDMVNAVEFKNNFVYRTVGDPPEGPYCPRCYAKNQKLVRLIEIQNRAYGCAVCQFILLRNGDGFIDAGEKTALVNRHLR